ncbi:MAG: AmmeMemoRadiSam system protein B [Candidatus Kapabacteria bacterium]|nr:AmmeMemoRadiSam system protein B [Candidatus Kapabacteria bacterium]
MNYNENEDFLLPKLREDLAFEVIENQDDKQIILYDPNGYAKQPIQIPISLIPLLQMLDGSFRKSDIIRALKDENDNQIEELIEPIFNLVYFLDQLGFLETETYYNLKNSLDEYLNSPVRKPVCAGNTYSDDPNHLRAQLRALMNTRNSDNIRTGAKMIIVPHIDFRVGIGALKTYAAAYHSIKNENPELIVIFGTSHYASSDYFMFTRKNFETPLGVVQTDNDVIEKLIELSNGNIKIDDLAHKDEHSIELQLVILQYLFGDKFKILPVLVGSFHNFIYSASLPKDDEHFNNLINYLKEAIEKTGKKTIFVASVDFAHIGRKFGDDFDAAPELEILKEEDKVLINHLIHFETDEFFKTVAKNKDQRKICGLSPIYSIMQMNKLKEGKFLEYSQWNETETKSAVSFASLAFYE